MFMILRFRLYTSNIRLAELAKNIYNEQVPVHNIANILFFRIDILSFSESIYIRF